MIIDTSALLAFVDRDEPAHEAALKLLTGATEPLVVSPYVIAELDYLIARRRGVETELTVLRDLGGGAWDLAAFTGSELRRAIGVIERYADQNIGVTDASLVVLADRYRTRTIATLDRRHFGLLRPLSGGRFRVVP